MPTGASVIRSARDPEACSRSLVRFPKRLSGNRSGKFHQGQCPKCNGSGPVDVHVNHKVWSALFLTQWSSTPQISCRSCGIKSQMAGAFFSLFLGWWGFPWGLLLTPIQIGRNVFGMVRPPEPSKASSQLEKIVRMTLASQAVQRQQAAPLQSGQDVSMKA